jgi:hypothetical protein
MELRNSGVRVSLCQGLGVRVMEVRNLGVSGTLVEGKMRVVEVRDLGFWDEAHEGYIS